MKIRNLAAAAVIAAVTLTALPATASAADGTIWSIQAAPVDKVARPNVSVIVERGAVHKDAVIVKNFSDQAMTLRVYAQDAFQSAQGGFDLRQSGQTPTDLGSWISVGVDYITVPAKGEVAVPFQIKVPENAPAGDHAAGIVASLTSGQTDASGAAVSVEHRVGTRVYLRVAGPVTAGLELRDVSVSYEQPSGVLGVPGLAGTGNSKITYTVVNTGNSRAAGTVHGTVAGMFGLVGQPVAETPIPEMLPGAQYTGELTVTGVAPLLRVNTDLTLSPRAIIPGSGSQTLEPTTAQASGWAVPWAWIALILVAAAGIGARIWTRRRKGDEIDLRGATKPKPADAVEIDLRDKVKQDVRT